MGLYEKMFDASVHPSTRDEVVDYYKAEYGNHWKARLADTVAAVAGIKRDSAMRRFQARNGIDPLAKPASKKHQKDYQEIGSKLTKEPKEGYRIKGKVCVVISGQTVTRKIDIQITGKSAKAFRKQPHIQGIINEYFQKGTYAQENAFAQACDEEEGERLSVTAG